MAVKSDLLQDFFRGDDIQLTLNVTDPDGVVVDITGATIVFTLKADPELDPDSSALIQQTAALTDPTNGVALIMVPNGDTDITPGNYHYDFELLDSAGKVTTLIASTVNVLQDVTGSGS